MGITLRHTAELIAHISVIADKQAFRPEYTSLFTYCVNELGLSEGETHVRIQVANVCRRHPELLDSLGENHMSLTVAGKLAPHLNQENAPVDCSVRGNDAPTGRGVPRAVQAREGSHTGDSSGFADEHFARTDEGRGES
ncbi:MAG: hypothetical protein H6833_07690 [Planctomycetes bacterium]|nr:hypothetical protein [Planctomycetota bacterium]